MQTITTRQFRDHVIAKSLSPNLAVTKQTYGFTGTADANVLSFVFSSKSVDLSGDRVFPDGIDFSHYLNVNPITTNQHNMSGWVIGKTVALDVVGDQLIGSIQFFTDLDEDGIGAQARAAVALIRRGVMGVSISFIPKTFELNSTDGLDILSCRLVECAVCSLPCNPDAYQIPPPSVSDIIAASVPDKIIDYHRPREAARRRRAITLTL